MDGRSYLKKEEQIIWGKKKIKKSDRTKTKKKQVKIRRKIKEK